MTDLSESLHLNSTETNWT